MSALGTLTRDFTRIGFVSFGGVAGQVALLHETVVTRRGWLDEAGFLRALNFCLLLPGPEAQQLATFVGWRVAGTRGAVIAGGLFVLPGALIMAGLAFLAARYGALPVVAGLFAGVKPVVVGIVAAALWRLGRRTLTGAGPLALAVSALVLLHWLHAPFPAVILGAAVIGLVSGRGVGGASLPRPGRGEPRRLARLVLIFLLLWALPVGVAVGLAGGIFPDLALLFTKSAFVTFGGAYAVLPYIADAAVHAYGWLSPAQMIDGLALAETTPGPTILVLDYVGFLAAYQAPGGLDPAVAGFAGAALVTYVTFLPSFLFILAGAPLVETLAAAPRAAAALRAIAAAVVGVMANLALFFGQAVLVVDGAPAWGAVAAALAALSVALTGRVAAHWLIAAGAAAGLILATA
ncbi:MAG: chromate efflux transporter [Zavarzinia sp.]